MYASFLMSAESSSIAQLACLKLFRSRLEVVRSLGSCPLPKEWEVLRLLSLICVQGIGAPSDINFLPAGHVLPFTAMGCAIDSMASLRRV